MKTFALIVSVVALVAMVAADEDPKRAAIEANKKHHDDCQADPATKVDEEVMAKFFKGESVDEAHFAKHALCMNVKSGLQKENGDIDTEALKKMVEERHGKVDEIVAECGVKKGHTAEETALEMFKCFRKYMPHHEHEHHDHDHHGHDHHEHDAKHHD